MLEHLPFVKHNWFSEKDTINDSIEQIKKDKVLIIIDHIKKTQWKEFEHRLESIGSKILVITDGLPIEWVTNSKINVITGRQYFLRTALDQLDNILKTNLFNHHKRQQDLLQFEFFMMYGRWEFHRELVVNELESKYLLKKSLYSRPAINQKAARSIESKIEPAPEKFRFSHKNNFQNVVKNCQKCHCAIVLENNGLLDETDSTLSEKFIWPILAQVPFIWIAGPQKIKKLLEWGFLPADPPRQSIRGLVEQLFWLQSEFQDPTKAQHWQDSQGNLLNRNLKKLKRLKSFLDEEFQKQMRQHGLNF